MPAAEDIDGACRQCTTHATCLLPECVPPPFDPTCAMTAACLRLLMAELDVLPGAEGGLTSLAEGTWARGGVSTVYVVVNKGLG